jgi:hypothetical protein
MNFNRGDIIHCSVTKADLYQPLGMKLTEGKTKHTYIVSKADGLCQNIPVEIGDQLLELNGKNVKQYTGGLKQLKTVIKKEKTIAMVVRRGPVEEDSDDDDSSYYEDEEKEEEEEEEYGHRQYEDDDDEEDGSERYDAYDIQPGSDMRLRNIDSKRKLNGHQVHVLSKSTRNLNCDEPLYECQLPDGSRIHVTSAQLSPIDEGQVDRSNPSDRSVMTNLIEAGDIMKIRGLKKHAKMNGTMVEILSPAEQPGRWECALCEDRDRVIAVLSENLRHVM